MIKSCKKSAKIKKVENSKMQTGTRKNNVVLPFSRKSNLRGS